MVCCPAYNSANGSACGWSMHSFLQNKTRLCDWLPMNRVQRKPTCHSVLCGEHFERRMFVISSSFPRSIGYNMNSVRLTEDAIRTIFIKQRDAKAKQMSSLMEKLNRKRVWISDNRVILGPNYWTFTSSHICE